MKQPIKPAERLGSVPVNSGVSSAGSAYGGSVRNGKFVPHATAEMVREVDPNGAIVVHPVRKSSYVHERLHNAGKLVDGLYDASEKFRMDFERAQLSGNYARTDLFRTRAPRGEISDLVASAKYGISKALEDLGGLSDSPSLAQSCIWNVAGLGMTLEEWTAVVRKTGANMNSDAASGVFRVALERLAIHYGLLDRGKLAQLRQNQAYNRAIRDFLEFLGVFGPKVPASDIREAAQKRFGKFV